MSRWIMNGGPTTCAGCGQPFPHCDGRIEAQVGIDQRLYCYGTTCEDDQLQASVERKRSAN